MMKKFLISLVLLSLVFFASCVSPEEDTEGKYNPFLLDYHLDADQGEFSDSYYNNHFKAVVITDEHLNKDSVKHYNDNLYKFLGEKNAPIKNYPFMISLGDLADDGRVSEEVLTFRSEILSRVGYFVEAVGNHDRHDFKYNSLDVISLIAKGIFKLSNNKETYAEYILNPANMACSTGRYVWKDTLSIYVIDTSRRNASYRQTEWLKKALEKDDRPYKIIISHNNLVSGQKWDKSLFFGGVADTEELTKLLNVLEEGGVSLVLSGHLHKAISPIKGDGYSEMNFSCFEGVDSPFEGKGSWYEAEFDGEKGEISFQEYDAETSSKKGEKEVFKLKKTN